ncbi:MAG TPA: hypothetical protein VNQ31_08010 [Sphingomonadaceae bacterium]|nr:hypothetical protein [Sphingomonadaceae bacterium]
MYGFVDRPIDELCGSSRFLLWAMRAWTSAVERRMCPPHALTPTFSRLCLMPMLPPFHTAMALLNRDGLANIVFAPIGHARIMEDEAIMLALWRNATLGRRDRCRDTLELLVDHASIAPAEAAIAAGAAALRATGRGPMDLPQASLRRAK